MANPFQVVDEKFMAEVKGLAGEESIDGHGGGGDDGGMDNLPARVGKLEDRTAAVELRLERVETKLDAIAVDVKSIKTNFWIGMLTIIAAVVATGIAIQQMTVSTFEGAARVARESVPVTPPAPAPPPIIINVPGAQPAPAPPAGN